MPNSVVFDPAGGSPDVSLSFSPTVVVTFTLDLTDRNGSTRRVSEGSKDATCKLGPARDLDGASLRWAIAVAAQSPEDHDGRAAIALRQDGLLLAEFKYSCHFDPGATPTIVSHEIRLQAGTPGRPVFRMTQVESGGPRSETRGSGDNLLIGNRLDQLEARPKASPSRGKIKWFNPEKGYGFIEQDGGEDLFIHHSAIAGQGFRSLQEGDQVRFEVVEGRKGQQAVNVSRLDRSAGKTESAKVADAEKTEADTEPSPEAIRLPPKLPAALAAVTPQAEDKAQPGSGDPTVCSLFSPHEIAPGNSIMLQAFLHLPAAADDAARLAREFDETATRRGYRTLEVPLKRGARVHLHLEVPKLIIADPIQSVIWRGQTEAVQFQLTAPADVQLGTAVGKMSVCVDSVPIGHLLFRLGISPAPATQESQPLGEKARLYKLVFISYASSDRSEVLKRVQMLSLFDVNFFQDLLELDPGERWERKLYQKIDQCDLFLLFWSNAAKGSEWVLKEAQYALARQRGDEMAPPEILPVLLEGPPPVSPPEGLKDLHFNDRLLYFMHPQHSSTASETSAP